MVRKEIRDITVYDDYGMRVSEVIPISPKVELESVLHGNEEPEQMRMYLDANHRNPYGPHRPQLVINMHPAGGIASISLYCEGKKKMFWEDK